jgi:hypothetical protein
MGTSQVAVILTSFNAGSLKFVAAQSIIKRAKTVSPKSLKPYEIG